MAFENRCPTPTGMNSVIQHRARGSVGIPENTYDIPAAGRAVGRVVDAGDMDSVVAPEKAHQALEDDSLSGP